MGSGKSTTAQDLATSIPKKNYYLKMDDLRWNITGYDNNVSASEKVITKLVSSTIQTCLSNGLTIILEGTRLVKIEF